MGRQRVRPGSSQDEGRPDMFPPPVRGWNAKDPLAQMGATDAVFLDNFFPQASNVILRPGYEEFATIPTDTVLSPHNVRTLLGYKSPAGTKKIFAAAEDGLYDISAGGTQLSTSTPATSNDWYWTNITTAGGSFLWACNGVDKSRIFDGTTWTLLDGASSPALTGVTSADITNVSLFKFRLIFCVKNKLSFYYLPVNSIAGAAVEFPLGPLFRKGGSLLATASWTFDSGEGSDDYFVALTTEGEVAIYKGTDPASASTWALVGVYYIGTPINKRSLTKYGGDLLCMTRAGLFPLTQFVQSTAIERTKALSDRIHNAYTDYVDAYSDLYGWQTVVFSEGPFILVNVPTFGLPAKNIIYSYQFVMNTSTKAWCRFVNMNAECWMEFDKELYFGSNNKVYKAWSGENDDGSSIVAVGQVAYNYFRTPRNKEISLIRPNIGCTGPVKISMGIDSDFRSGRKYSSQSTYAETESLFDSAVYGIATWTGNTSGIAQWKTIPNYMGKAKSVRLRAECKDVTMHWDAVEVILKDGGLL